jgi:hypothetical protein
MDQTKPRHNWMLCCGIPAAAIGVALMLFGPDPWGPQAAIVVMGVATLLICGRGWRNGL